ncbi:hypothetical protein BAUCODRAFT_120068 [Baudoinia panamericana UAMH 10762]|uniref:Transcription factor domain-containing protein n=1 Tax=Baudoinia panamericana (strain UAMH 10762) TaxID=717646 RepID=M2LVS9_BAUPA|nr:uncharacterized protein BAUCODRAFT_120068 [Baudoinia panamericana UAMH 10762]EMC98767.1 hypothetical protein BAUCODRAFT_120068 [Baudoinia panamericana UAMH 10762]
MHDTSDHVLSDGASAGLNLADHSAWPAERHPTRWDVDEANHVPTSMVVDRFRSALLHAESEDVVKDAMSWDLNSYVLERPAASAHLPYTYPMVLLSSLPSLPSDHDLLTLRQAYFPKFERHVFVRDLGSGNLIASSNPPYLRLATACVAAILSDYANVVAEESLGTNLFAAGARVWTVMVEVDNREARNVKTIVAAALLSTYGSLSMNNGIRRKTSEILCNIITMSRRLRLSDATPSAYSTLSPSERDIAGKGSLLCYIVLVDIVHSLSNNTAPNYSVRELELRMPSSNHSFSTVYSSLLHGHVLPGDLSTTEDGLLLIIALLSDVYYVQKCHPRLLDQFGTSSVINPYRPLCSNSELAHMTALFDGALSRWKQRFFAGASHDVLALYYFTLLQLRWPDVPELPTLLNRHTAKPTSEAIPSECLSIAWAIHANVESASANDTQRLSIWLPCILYLSALVVWRSHSQDRKDMSFGGLSSLRMYEFTLSQLPWPCCPDMVRVLETLRRQSGN